MTDLVPTTSGGLADRMQYAKALAAASLLPAAYRNAPANVLLAMEYGDALGLAPIAAIQGVHVIDGKPTASAQLIGALVRRAGHRLRVEVSPDGTAARATVIRSDDPDFEFVSVWTLARAEAAGLTGKGTWQKFPTNLLKARAITEVARDACPEALSGVAYTAEEIGHDDDDARPVERVYAPNGVDPWHTSDAPEPGRDYETPHTVEPVVVDAVVVDPVVKGGRRQAPATAAQRQYLGRWVRSIGYPDTATYLESSDAETILGGVGFDDSGTWLTAETMTKAQASVLIEAAKRFEAETSEATE